MVPNPTQIFGLVPNPTQHPVFKSKKWQKNDQNVTNWAKLMVTNWAKLVSKKKPTWPN